MKNAKLLAVLFGVAVASSAASFLIKKMSDRVDNQELVKNVGNDVVHEVVDQVSEEEV